MNAITVSDLTKKYKEYQALNSISFSVKEGELFAFLGENGAGKSTTIRHLMGFSKPDSGQTLLFGKPTFEKYD